MRRIAKSHRCISTTTLLVLALALSAIPGYAKSKAQHRVLIKVNNTGRINQLANKYGLNVKKSVSRGASEMFVVEDIPVGVLKNSLKGESDIEWIVEDRIVPLDGG